MNGRLMTQNRDTPDTRDQLGKKYSKTATGDGEEQPAKNVWIDHRMQMRTTNTELALPQQGKYTPMGIIEMEPQKKDGNIAQDNKEE